jgi:hypothetical protein
MSQYLLDMLRFALFILRSILGGMYQKGILRDTNTKCGGNLLLNYYIWRIQSSGIYSCVVHWKSTNVLEEHVTSIFKVE